MRILLVWGGNSKNPFGELVETTLGSTLPYEAISYVWANSTRSRSLALRGGLSLKITESLYNALRSIRHSKIEDGARAVWADGVCINQEDVVERGQQVKLMAEIYHSACRVITYVGEDVANVERGIDLASNLIRCSKELETCTPVTSNLADRVHRKHGIPRNRYHPAWHSLRDFLHRPWYTRMWIIQESLHNDNMVMMCGKTSISWEIFTQFCKVIETGVYNSLLWLEIQPDSERRLGAMGQMARLRTEYRQRQISLLELLASSRDLDCSDPRDRVFALTSLLRDAQIDTDYTKSAARLFTEIASAMLSSYGPIVLSYAGVNGNLAVDVASWVPDWSFAPTQIPVFQCRRFNSSGATAWSMGEIDLASGSLRISSKIFDKIVDVTDTLRRAFVTARMTRSAWVRDQYLRLTASRSAYPGGGSYVNAFWRTIISDLNPEDRFQGSSAPVSLARDFEAYVRPDKARAKREASKAFPMPNIDPTVVAAWERERDMDGSALDEGYKEDEFSSLRGGNAVIQGRGGDRYRDVILKVGNLYWKLFTTEKGYIGMCVEGVTVGDDVAFFVGVNVSFVLRSLSPISKYQLVGDCYVHGLMNGEVF
jgi:Heterokaryon incompatibility protein (HET)